ncbi:MAG: dihydrofolate reductase family protein, partial [Myxococcota bacterium]
MASKYEDIIARFDEARRRVDGENTFITLSFAQSLDGSVSLRPGERTHLSGESSLEMTHALRARHDAIVVGIGTVLVDNPRLSVRLNGTADQPLRVILDRDLRTPPSAQLFSSVGGPVHLICDESAPREREQALRDKDATIWRWPTPDLEPARLRLRLRDLGIKTAMVE